MKETIFSKVCRSMGKKGSVMLVLLAFLLLGSVDANAQYLTAATNDSATEYSLVNDSDAVVLLKSSLTEIKQDHAAGVTTARKTYAIVKDIVLRVKEGITLEDAIDNSLDEMLPADQFATRGEIFNRIINFVEQ